MKVLALVLTSFALLGHVHGAVLCPDDGSDEAVLVSNEPVDVKVPAFKTCIIEDLDVKNIKVEEGATVEITSTGASGCSIVDGSIKCDKCESVIMDVDSSCQLQVDGKIEIKEATGEIVIQRSIVKEEIRISDSILDVLQVTDNVMLNGNKDITIEKSYADTFDLANNQGTKKITIDQSKYIQDTLTCQSAGPEKCQQAQCLGIDITGPPPGQPGFFDTQVAATTLPDDANPIECRLFCDAAAGNGEELVANFFRTPTVPNPANPPTTCRCFEYCVSVIDLSVLPVELQEIFIFPASGSTCADLLP